MPAGLARCQIVWLDCLSLSLPIVYRQHPQLQLTVFKQQLIMGQRIWKRHHTKESPCLRSGIYVAAGKSQSAGLNKGVG